MKRRRRRPAGFIFIVGWRVITTRERKPVVVARCPGCGVDKARLVGRVKRAWFTLFFIPIVPMVRADGAQRISQCRECRKLFDMPVEQLARRAGVMSAGDFSKTILVYNELRDHPADGRIMLKLLKMYDQLGELGEAESAARHYPSAIAADPACAALLRKMRREGANK